MSNALETLQRHTHQPAAAVMSFEIGGFNALEPLVVGAQAGLPVVDADQMGRAFPQLQVRLMDQSEG